jgi:hypothetical protein
MDNAEKIAFQTGSGFKTLNGRVGGVMTVRSVERHISVHKRRPVEGAYRIAAVLCVKLCCAHIDTAAAVPHTMQQCYVEVGVYGRPTQTQGIVYYRISKT